jgi:CRISPR/Cas system CSM-associated protein Csm2 small subunit
MVSGISPISINTVAFMHSSPILSQKTIGQLKELGISVSSVKSEAEARRIIEKKTQEKEIAQKSLQSNDQLGKIYQRIKNLALKIDVSVSSGEKIETMLSKIRERIALFEENNNDSNISALRAEYDSIKYTYETLTSTRSDVFTGLDIMGSTNRAIMGIKK